jgi:hypothetical protein
MTCWKVVGVLQRPNSIVVNSNKPYLLTKAVFGTSASRTGIWLYALVMSSVEKTLAPDTASKQSEVRGKGKASFSVRRFNLL